jgi:hypothetical protein
MKQADKEWPKTSTGLTTGAARDAIARMYRQLARLDSLVERLPPTEAASVAAELLLPCERLDALCSYREYMERLAPPSSGQPAAASIKQPAVAGTEAVTPS